MPGDSIYTQGVGASVAFGDPNGCCANSHISLFLMCRACLEVGVAIKQCLGGHFVGFGDPNFKVPSYPYCWGW